MLANRLRALALSLLLVVESGGKQVEEDLHQGAGLYPGPYFDNSLTKIVRARKGSHAYLSCRVHQLDNKSVSWVRRKDAHIISVGESSFIQDPRFRVYHFPRDHMWTLQIQDVRPEDSGEYECQISTEPKRSFLVLLKVLRSPSLEIIGSPDVYVKAGSAVDLKCKISDLNEEEQMFVFWFHNGTRILDVPDGPGSSLKAFRLENGVEVETFSIEETQLGHAGNYTCQVAEGQQASVVLHVIQGERPQAMHEGNSSGRPGCQVATVVIWTLFTRLRGFG